MPVSIRPRCHVLMAVILSSWSAAGCAGSSDDTSQQPLASAVSPPDAVNSVLTTTPPPNGSDPVPATVATMAPTGPATTLVAPAAASGANEPEAQAPASSAMPTVNATSAPPALISTPTENVAEVPAPSVTGTEPLPSTMDTATAAPGEPPHAADHCLYGRDPEPSDATMADGAAEFFPPGKEGDKSIVDLTLQPEVLDWMYEHKWQEVHIEWHAIRTCGVGARGSHIDICQYTQLIPTDQNCQSKGDGLQFLMFHRHMMESLKQMWPNHAEQFTGFETFPSSADDVPEQWRAAWKPFSDTAAANGKIGDEIDKPENLAMFEDEGQLGFWLQCLPGQVLDGFATSGIHGDLHGHWVRAGNTTHGVGNTNANIDNYMFYKLHGWIDNVWERYREAKGLTRDDAVYQAGMLAQCREMDTLEQIELGMPPDLDGPAGPSEIPVESGFFHEKVRPILENQTNHCNGCHSESGPEVGLTLGGSISSADIVAGLVNQPSLDGGDHVLVKPGLPDESWLYLKASGKSLIAECNVTPTSMCINGVMPPASSGQITMTAEELEILAQWITDGALAPTAAE